MLLEATRWRCSSAAQGWKGRPSLKEAPRFQNWLVLTDNGIMSFVCDAGGVAGGGAGAGVPGGRSYSQIPERSGCPSVALGAGPDKFGLPSAVLGTLGVG